MAIFEVKEYILRYDMKRNVPWFTLSYKKADGEYGRTSYYPPAGDAVFISDMLRNEKPIYYVESENRRYVTTTYEEVGEEESS